MGVLLHDVADDCLSARMRMHDLHDLLATAVQLGQRLNLHRKGAEQLHGRIAGTLKLRDLMTSKTLVQCLLCHRVRSATRVITIVNLA